MSYLVPFDGSPLSAAALARARGDVIAVEEAPPEPRAEQFRQARSGSGPSASSRRPPATPGDGWIGGHEEFGVREVVQWLHWQVTDITPGPASSSSGVTGAATARTVSSRLRQRAEGPRSVVFVGRSTGPGSVRRSRASRLA